MTPIRGCDIFRNATPQRRFFDVPKKTPRGTSATLNLALPHRRAPRPAAQNVAQNAAQIAPGRPADATRFAKAIPACHLSVAFSTCQKSRREALPRRSIWHCDTGVCLAPRPKTWPKRRPKSHQAGPRTPRDLQKQWRRVRKCVPKCGALKTLRGFSATLHSALRDRRVPRHGPKRDPNWEDRSRRSTRERHPVAKRGDPAARREAGDAPQRRRGAARRAAGV